MRRLVVLAVLLGLVGTQAAAQATDFSLRRFGDSGVTDAEVVQITDLVNAKGRGLWLIRSRRAMEGNRVASVFLEPDVVGTNVLRGRMTSLVADYPSATVESPPWRVRQSYSYACIPAQGHRPGEIGREQDIDWPFIVEGEFDDQTLVSIIEFVRARPLVAEPKEKDSARIFVPDAPVSSMRRVGNGIVIVFRLDEAQGQSIRLAQKGDGWTITDFDWWIV